MKNPFEAFRDYFEDHPSKTSISKTGREQESNILPILPFFEKIREESTPLAAIVLNNTVIEGLYKKIIKLVENYAFSASQIEDFTYKLCLELIKAPFDSIKGGIFISALINTSPGKLFFLEIPDSNHLVHFLGYQLPEGKTIEIDGNTGDFLGMNLSGGTISVSGNVRDWAGTGMKGGRIVINGSCGRFACEWMRGGNFLVTGKIESLGKVIKGEIREHWRE